jgi:hypothetical protein
MSLVAIKENESPMNKGFQTRNSMNSITSPIKRSSLVQKTTNRPIDSRNSFSSKMLSSGKKL